MSRADMMARRERILAIKDEVERKKEIALWVVDTIWDIKRHTPPLAPKEYTDFKALGPHDQRKAVDGGFWQDPAVADYINARDYANQQNVDNVKWLKEVVEWLPKWDTGNRQIITEKLVEITQGSFKPTEAIEIDWNK